jgi:hypothetical protein
MSGMITSPTTIEQLDPGGGEQNDPLPLTDPGVVVDVEAELLGVEARWAGGRSRSRF